MNNSKFIIDQIKRKYKISEYLSNKGITPKRVSANKQFYVCPIHKDSDPSFCLYMPSSLDDCENYFCFGCKSSSSIVTLMGELDFGGGVEGWKKAIQHLSQGVDNSPIGEISFLIDELKRQIEETRSNVWSEKSLVDNSLIISRLGDFYLSQTGYDRGEVEFLEKVYKTVDSYILKNDLKTLEDSKNFLIKQLNKRLLNFKKEQKFKRIKNEL